ncbi:MAG: DNA-3-methyladenine glycosylase [Anaerocolumna sp.]|nr:DNA-3-methyladenine glycosylase [Anaerocolumna sp.]
MYFEYGDIEIEFLKHKDKKMAEVIEKIGHIHRTVDEDLFSSVIHHIIGQQISTAAQTTIWRRMKENLIDITPNNICSQDISTLQKYGMTYKKAEYIKDFAIKINISEFDLFALANMEDEEVKMELSALKGIGIWTAEMIMLFCLKRPNVFSFGDLAIHRGLRMLYRHKTIDRERFEKYRKRFSPYGSVASLYLWSIAGGAIPELSDPASKLKKKKL